MPLLANGNTYIAIISIEIGKGLKALLSTIRYLIL